MLIYNKEKNAKNVIDFTNMTAADLAQEKLNSLKADKERTGEGACSFNEIYANSEITMGVPNELYMDGYVRYLRGEISLDGFINKETANSRHI